MCPPNLYSSIHSNNTLLTHIQFSKFVFSHAPFVPDILLPLANFMIFSSVVSSQSRPKIQYNSPNSPNSKLPQGTLLGNTDEHNSIGSDTSSSNSCYLSARSCGAASSASSSSSVPDNLCCGCRNYSSFPSSSSPSSSDRNLPDGDRKKPGAGPETCSDTSSSSPSSRTTTITTAYCALCQLQISVQSDQDTASSSEETLKRADSRLTNSATVDRGSASTPQSAQSSSAFPGTRKQQQQQVQQQQQFVEVDNRIPAKGCSCEECLLLARQQQLQQLQQQHDQLPGTSGGLQQAPGGGRTPLSIAALAGGGSGPTTSSSVASAPPQQIYCSNGPTGGGGMTVTQTIEEQIKQIDRISKECDNSRKSLELINRRLDDLNDEVRRYREFLGHEKARRDPALYKTSTAEPLSAYNDNICRLIDSLTTQLTMEWTEKLRSIQHQTIAKFVSEKG